MFNLPTLPAPSLGARPESWVTGMVESVRMRLSSGLLRGATPLLLALTLTLAGVVGVEAWFALGPGAGSPALDVKPRPPRADSLPAVPPPRQFAVPPIDAYQEIVTRPLFAETRRPPEESPEPAGEEVATPVPAQPLPDGLRLTSVVLTEDTRMALLQDPRSKRLARLRVGQEFEGWRVAEILPGRIVLEQNGNRETLELRVYNKAVRPPPGVPFPGAAQGATPAARGVRQLRRPRVAPARPPQQAQQPQG
jgi:hypothetical protein